jgi:hypothetical protein
MQYNATLASAQSAIQTFHDDMQQYQNDEGTTSGLKAKRQVGAVLTAALRVDLENLHGDFNMLKVVQASISTNLTFAIDKTFRSLSIFALYLVKIS